MLAGDSPVWQNKTKARLFFIHERFAALSHQKKKKRKKKIVETIRQTKIGRAHDRVIE